MSISERIDSPPPTEEATGQMAHYGITCVPVDYYHFGGFRYTSFADALSEAQRQAEQDGMTAQTRWRRCVHIPLENRTLWCERLEDANAWTPEGPDDEALRIVVSDVLGISADKVRPEAALVADLQATSLISWR